MSTYLVCTVRLSFTLKWKGVFNSMTVSLDLCHALRMMWQGFSARMNINVHIDRCMAASMQFHNFKFNNFKYPLKPVAMNFNFNTCNSRPAAYWVLYSIFKNFVGFCGYPLKALCLFFKPFRESESALYCRCKQIILQMTRGINLESDNDGCVKFIKVRWFVELLKRHLLLLLLLTLFFKKPLEIERWLSMLHVSACTLSLQECFWCFWRTVLHVD